MYEKEIEEIAESLERSESTEVSQRMVKSLYNEMSEAFIAAGKAECSRLRRVTGREYRRVSPGRYFPRHLHSKAFGAGVKQLMCKCKIANREVEIRFGVPGDCEPIVERLAASVQCIMAVLHFCGKYSKRQCSKTLHVVIILLDDLKRLPESAVSTIGAPHVNSGFSGVCQTENEIVVYRAEEWFKVFIHESFHAFGLEGALTFAPSSAGVRKLFNVASTMSLGEAYVETWARVLNASVASFVRSEDYPEFSDLLRFSLMIECRFAALQSTKVLGFMGLEYDTVCDRSNNASRLMYKEDTNVFSYYVIACVLMCNVDAFLRWCARHNTSWARFGDSDADVGEFTRFVGDIYRNANTLNNVESVRGLQSHPGMRMSIIDVW